MDERGAQDSVRQERLLHALRTVRDDDMGALERLWQLRSSPDYETPFVEPEPLVTIVVITYREWELLRDRSLPSILAQTYQNFEVIVVGDDAVPETAEVVAGFNDDRLRFVNLPYRGPYPEDPIDAWRIAGSKGFNAGMEVARGQWIGFLDDDDAFVPGHLKTLIELAQRERAEVAYGAFRYVLPDGSSWVAHSSPPASGLWAMQASVFHRGLRHMTLNTNDWLFEINNDMSLLDRLLRIGVRFAATSELVFDYFPGTLWKHDGKRETF